MTDWAFLIGVSEYDNSMDFLPLAFCDQYVEEIADILQDGGYQKDRIFTLTSVGDRKSNKNQIMASFIRFLRNIKPKDNLVIYFVGHGGTFQDTGYLFPKDAYIDHRDLNTM
ncbi:MAG: hypothetical protein ACFFDT_25015, partial [Candidatus Hodarchaeota archaeon]